MKEMLPIDSGDETTIVNALYVLYQIKNDCNVLNEDVRKIRESFKIEDMYQFLDCPTYSLFFDAILNQISYPFHYNTEKIKRFSYTAKTNKMYLDIIPMDECRYIYDWLPTIYMIDSMIQNVNLQYTFRFALDGLIKHRLNYNNEFFFQGSVINDKTTGFERKKLAKREIIEQESE